MEIGMGGSPDTVPLHKHTQGTAILRGASDGAVRDAAMEKLFVEETDCLEGIHLELINKNNSKNIIITFVIIYY